MPDPHAPSKPLKLIVQSTQFHRPRGIGPDEHDYQEPIGASPFVNPIHNSRPASQNPTDPATAAYPARRR
jgi:hypothetical protein